MLTKTELKKRSHIIHKQGLSNSKQSILERFLHNPLHFFEHPPPSRQCNLKRTQPENETKAANILQMKALWCILYPRVFKKWHACHSVLL